MTDTKNLTFTQKLLQRWNSSNSLLCVGLDPDPKRFPAHLASSKAPIFDFCREIVDATADLACAFKPQIAYFASCAAEDQLSALMEHMRSHHPQIPIILDAKRGDIGSTAEHYAREAFERYNADALTVSPYMGSDSLEPYLAYKDRGLFVLCRTSNPGGSDLQALRVPTDDPNQQEFLYEKVARLCASKWNTHGQIGLVVGATFPNELATVRAQVGDMPLLIPGVGAQGGDVQATVLAGANSCGSGMLINSSRAILYAGNGEDFAIKAREVASNTRDAINQYRPTCATSSP